MVLCNVCTYIHRHKNGYTEKTKYVYNCMEPQSLMAKIGLSLQAHNNFRDDAIAYIRFLRRTQQQQWINILCNIVIFLNFVLKLLVCLCIALVLVCGNLNCCDSVKLRWLCFNVIYLLMLALEKQRVYWTVLSIIVRVFVSQHSYC